jgi:hypothetical protein
MTRCEELIADALALLAEHGHVANGGKHLRKLLGQLR